MKKILVFGTFDHLHEGHLDFFRQAKLLGTYLIVVVARDKNAFKAKGYLPDQNESERLKMVKKAREVNKAILGSKNMNYYQTIRNEKPNIIGLGYDQKPKINELKKDLEDHDLKTLKIVRLKSYKPSIHKSSLIRKKYDRNK